MGCFKMSSTYQHLLTWSLPQFLLLSLTHLWLLAPPTGVSADVCRVTGGVLGLHWTSVISLGWYPLTDGRGGPTCWETCCLRPSCNAVWSLGGRCVLLSCSLKGGCPILFLPQPDQDSLGLLQILTKSSTPKRGRSLRDAEHEEQTEQQPSTETAKLDLVHPTVLVSNSSVVSQADQKNISSITNRSSEHAPQQNSSIVLNTAASSNTSDVSPPTATVISTGPTLAVRELVVSAGESVEVTLPRNSVELNAFVVPPLPPDATYAFDWRLITHPKDYSGEMEGKHSKTLKLSKLTVGLYEFEVTVDGGGAHGEGYVNVTVKPEPRVNKPPVAVVSPKFQEISLPTSSTVIDGSQSTDDDKVVAWHWEEVKGPLREEKVSANTPVLTLTNLVPGNYTFNLTVTDSDGAQDSTQATLSVNKAKDYKPVANAGPNQVITLPRNSITLYGNQSTDDHDTLAYEWSLSPESKDKVVEMQGVRTHILQLSAMQEGDYTFQLTVTDSAGQQDTAHVTVIVQPENNKPPQADAGPEKELTLPVDRTTLDGSKSTDDQKIVTYHWKQTKGPDGVKIENGDSAVATVTGLEVGTYEFTLTVTDERKLQSSDTVTVVVREELDQPPVARVVSSPPVSLPVRTATLDGSHSTDDKGGISYLWTRDDSSPAAGDVMNNSDRQAILFLGNLVQGKYSFTLSVTDSKGQSSTDSGTLEVRPDPWESDQVEMVLEVPITQISHRQRDMLLRQVGVLLGVLDSDIIVREIGAFNEHSTRLVFLVSGGPGRPPLSGHSVALTLRNKLRKQKNDFLIFKPRRVDTVICQLNCSSHGECDSFSRRCVCHPFWMENFIRAQLGDAESNCEWSVLYVTIASFMIVVALATVVWGCVCCCDRRKSKPRRTKSRYKMLEADEQDALELQPPRAGRIKPVPAPTSSALMHSDSDLDSDDGQVGFSWTEQERGHLLRPQNGALKNGQGPMRGKKHREELL
ncbi:dyslexia-associated protein KIAA0319-like protein [Syngnathoides biaculeatus]|uniref:dyslexia-associated protein KIAA0319-like protein n=1 Tax=Syngnathoides biaculeatus TaxID=300417 RepID=UPI002ADDB8B2|nr:dyslexia-associated protein KIAA0319-like protein [Syngnathoides biaculeatus]XP_061695763.1 dyslexia-associated protein KIAA0319-like protein [Syngnathoides biaculeatus]XP_061696508.1 dyslexia-associated protein KIAA0319-like protein [Syngnathoides biaculeatus]XP_061697280.1 dyslexia-associated protein KIAA0319-like protein [Syngnathoides biaculeatus]XP_061698095.1 dyslexia-associated protein KIAA0319-like protein [Syngnathoides biaculeatus]XP_061698865.1 dyslexia-associated protein KIAA031